MFQLRETARRTARRAGLLTGGLFLCCVGVGFLTIAGWLALVPTVGMQMAAMIVAAAYLGVGLILIGVSTSSPAPQDRRSDAPRQDSAAHPDTPPILQAFMYGLQAGARADQARHGHARGASSST